LDALASRFEVTGYDRSFHGALLDANILADVYIHLTGGQSKFEFITSNASSNSNSQSGDLKIDFKKFPIPKISVSQEDILTHDQRITAINSKRESS
jgi:DNA polymerase-3 subunit epsilon